MDIGTTPNLDSAGFARPKHDPIPEELLPTTIKKESLIVTVPTSDGTNGNKAPSTIVNATKTNRGYNYTTKSAIYSKR